MPSYDRQCLACDRDFEVFVPIRQCQDPQPCPSCGGASKKVILEAPFLNNPEVRILDYPGSKKFKAGHVHSHGDRPVTKVSAGYGGVLNPSTRPVDPDSKGIRPEAVRFSKKVT